MERRLLKMKNCFIHLKIRFLWSEKEAIYLTGQTAKKLSRYRRERKKIVFFFCILHGFNLRVRRIRFLTDIREI